MMMKVKDSESNRHLKNMTMYIFKNKRINAMKTIEKNKQKKHIK